MLLFEMNNTVSIRTKPQNLNRFDEGLFASEYQKEIGVSSVFKYDNVLIFNNCCAANNTGNNRLETFKFIISQFNNNLGIKKVNQFLFNCALSSFLPKKQIESGCWVVDHWSHDYFHWITECIAKIIYLSKCNIIEPVLLPQQFTKYSYIIESLKYFNIQFVIIPSTRHINVKKLFTAEFEYDVGNFDARILGLIVSRLTPPDNSIISKPRIWISRAHAKKRRILNEIELYPILAKHNIEIVHTESLSFSEQVSLFQQAKMVVGLHGAGLTNMLFMQSGGYIIEIRKKGDNHSNCYFTLASDLQHKYYYLLADTIDEQLHEGDCTVNPTDLDLLLTNVIQHVI